MGHGVRVWLAGLGTAAAVSAAAVGLAPLAGASMAGQPAKSSPSAYVPSSRTLTFGSKGTAVKALQRRLNALGYYAGSVDGYLGWSTMEAVWAFKEVQSGKAEPTNPDVVGPTMQHQLVNPKLPQVLIKKASWARIEINKNVGVLVLYGKHNKIRLISHVSTAAYNRPDGSGWVTPDGKYRALWFAAGWVGGPLGSMWNPVVFTPNGAFAIHGEPNPTSTFGPDGVPLNAASHGCVRIPMDIANFFHNLIHISPSNGILIYIRGANQDETGI